MRRESNYLGTIEYIGHCLAHRDFFAIKWIEELRTFPIPTAAGTEASVAVLAHAVSVYFKILS